MQASAIALTAAMMCSSSSGKFEVNEHTVSASYERNMKHVAAAVTAAVNSLEMAYVSATAASQCSDMW
eukprot:12104-Heterococcus_DN1.PRE.1